MSTAVRISGSGDDRIEGDPMKAPWQRRPFVRHFVATLLVGAFAGYLVLADIDYSLHAEHGEATLVSSGLVYRSGATVADAVHTVNGFRVAATLRVYCRPLSAGDLLSVCYLPDDPKHLTLDDFWQRHFMSVIALLVFELVVTFEARKFAALNRRSARERRISVECPQ